MKFPQEDKKTCEIPHTPSFAWHFSDLKDKITGDFLILYEHASVGNRLTGGDENESSERGGDGYSADFEHGYLLGNIKGLTDKLQDNIHSAMGICIRLKFNIEPENITILGCYQNNEMVFCMESACGNTGKELCFKFVTDDPQKPFSVSIPFNLISISRWYDIIFRYTNVKMELFLDGILIDEEWPIGMFKHYDNIDLYIGGGMMGKIPVCGFNGAIDHLLIWNNLLSDTEVEVLSGSRPEVEKRKKEIYPDSIKGLQYWRPDGHNTRAGDCMPFYHDGIFHLFYLFDRRRHHSKRGLGAHQWAHASSTDLMNWTHHPIAIPISEEWEGSICTGSMFYHNGIYYGFYAVRMTDNSAAQLSVATSEDGIHFSKHPPLASLKHPYNAPVARDPIVFKDENDGLFHMLVTSELIDTDIFNHGGCLAHLVSRDLWHWEQRSPFIVPGLTGQPECSDYFFLNGWYYLLFSNDGIARYRMSKYPSGPWLKPWSEILDCPGVCVPKTAAFKGNRRILAGFLNDNNQYAGSLVFHEIIQHNDGTLGIKFPKEMYGIKKLISPVFGILTKGTYIHKGTLIIDSLEGFNAVEIKGVPKNVIIAMVITPGNNASSFGLCLRAEENYKDGLELRFEPGRQKAGFRNSNCNTIDENERSCIYNIENLNQPFTIEVILYNDIVDVCIDNRRTLTSTELQNAGDRIFLFSHNSSVKFEDIKIWEI